jgi:hypothetical protein
MVKWEIELMETLSCRDDKDSHQARTATISTAKRMIQVPIRLWQRTEKHRLSTIRLGSSGVKFDLLYVCPTALTCLGLHFRSLGIRFRKVDRALAT